MFDSKNKSNLEKKNPSIETYQPKLDKIPTHFALVRARHDFIATPTTTLLGTVAVLVQFGMIFMCKKHEVFFPIKFIKYNIK
jgi:hypothetical protein